MYAEQVGASVGELAIVGDFDAEPALKQVVSFVAGWKASVPYQRIVYTPKLDVPGGTESILTPDKKNAVYLAGHLLALKDTAPDYPALELGNYVLGGGGFTSLLMDRVRQKEGLSYGVESNLSADAQDDYGSFMVDAICNPGNINRVDRSVAEVLGKALKDGVDPAHLKAAQKGYVEEAKVGRSRDDQLVSTLASYLYLDRTFQYDADLEGRIARMTVEEVNAALRRYIDPRRLVIIRAGDLEKAKAASAR
jgi:zinc protease